ncbi:MAG: hypothetical protein C0402_01525 [Thermodesulfovibrio sp.]|nr:hypothetical protein [Thermodesulfovibrio sp.]
MRLVLSKLYKFGPVLVLFALLLVRINSVEGASTSSDVYSKLLEKAEAGDARSQLELGLLYYNGIGFKPDAKLAFDWIRKAADQGQVSAQFHVGEMLGLGDGVPRDITEAKKWYEKAALQGDANAAFSLAVIYRDEANFQLAYKWFLQAAEKNDKIAAYNIGLMYESGNGVKTNIDEAFKWYEKAKTGDNFARDAYEGARAKKGIYDFLKTPYLHIRKLSFEALIGIVLAVVGIYLTVKSKKEKVPSYAYWGFNIVTNFKFSIGLLEMLCNGQRIENLTVSKIVFWNAGSETMHREDIVNTDRLRVSLPDTGDILDAKIIYANEPANQFSLVVEENRKNVYIDYDYIDRGNGVVMQFIHTNPTPDAVVVSGKLKGVRKIKRRSAVYASLRGYLVVAVPLLFMLVFMSALATKVFSLISYKFAFFIGEKTLVIPFVAMFLFLSCLAVARTVVFLRSRIPRDLSLFGQEVQ